MALIKVFTGSGILAMRLKEEMEAEGVKVILRDDILSAILGGFGASHLAVELYITDSDYVLVEEIIDEFNNNL
jgi:putative signal transducing protein